MAPITESTLFNALAEPSQLEMSASQLDGVSQGLEDSIRYNTARILQAGGILLQLPQEIIAQAVVLLFRFWAGPEGASMLLYDTADTASAALYLACKPSATPIGPRQALTTFAYLRAFTSVELSSSSDLYKVDRTWSFTQGQYETARLILYQIELHMLKVLGFQTHVALPYALCINQLQTLDVCRTDSGLAVTKRAFEHLNSALVSPQQLYLTHQPSALAVAAVYLAARELKVKLPELEWWEVFDVDREELGFLVVSLQSVATFATEEYKRWPQRRIAMTVEEIRAEIQASASSS